MGFGVFGQTSSYPLNLKHTNSMKTQRIGYIRVSTEDQNLARQLEGVELDRIFQDKVSGKDTSRPQLTELLAYARDGDVVVGRCASRRSLPPTTHRLAVRSLRSRPAPGETPGLRSALAAPLRPLRAA